MIRLRRAHADRVGTEAREVIHLGLVGGGFLGNEHGSCAAEDGAKAVEHPGRAADDVVGAERGVSGVQPLGQADAAGDAVQFGDGETVVGEHEVGADDERHIGAGGLAAAKGDEVGGFAGVEVGGDPGGLLAGHGTVVKLIAGALQEIEAVTELFELLAEPGVDDERLRRHQPVLFRKKPLRGLGGAEGGETVERRGHAPG